MSPLLDGDVEDAVADDLLVVAIGFAGPALARGFFVRTVTAGVWLVVLAIGFTAIVAARTVSLDSTVICAETDLGRLDLGLS